MAPIWTWQVDISANHSLDCEIPLCILLLPCSMTCVCVCVCLLCEQVRYKIRAKELLKSGCNELHRPDLLNAMYNTSMWSKVTICLQALPQAPGNLIPPFSIHPNCFFVELIPHYHFLATHHRQPQLK